MTDPTELDIDLDKPGRIGWSVCPALAWRFFAFCPAFAFARCRALAFVVYLSLFLGARSETCV